MGVTVVGMEKAPLERVMGEQVGRVFQKSLEKNGVKFKMSAGVEKAVPSESDSSKVGDIALSPYHGPGGGGSLPRIEHWNVAQNAGRSVAANIIDPSAAAKAFIPIFWSALGSQLRYCGNTPNGFDDLVLQGQP